MMVRTIIRGVSGPRLRGFAAVVTVALAVAIVASSCGRGDGDDRDAGPRPSRVPSTEVVPTAPAWTVEMVPTSTLPICKPVTSIITDPAKAPPPERCGVDPAIGRSREMDEAIRRNEELEARGERDLGGMVGYEGPWFRVPQGTGHLVVDWSAPADAANWAADVLVRNDTRRPAVLQVDARLRLRDGSTAAASGTSAIVARPGEPVPVRVLAAVPPAEVVDVELVASTPGEGSTQNRSFQILINYQRVSGDRFAWGFSFVNLRGQPVEVPTVVVGVLGDDGFRILDFVVHVGHQHAGTGLVDPDGFVGGGLELPVENLPGDAGNLRTLVWAYSD